MGVDLLELLRGQLRSNIRTAQSRVRAREDPARSLAQARVDALRAQDQDAAAGAPFWITERLSEENQRAMEQRLSRLSRAALETMAETPIVDTVSLLTEIPFSKGFWTRLIGDRLTPEDEQRLVDFGIGPYSTDIGDEILVDVFRFLHGERAAEWNPFGAFVGENAFLTPATRQSLMDVDRGAGSLLSGLGMNTPPTTAVEVGLGLARLLPRPTSTAAAPALSAGAADTGGTVPPSGFSESFGGPQPSTADVARQLAPSFGLTARPMPLDDGGIYLVASDESGSVVIGVQMTDAQGNQWWEPLGRPTDPRQLAAVQQNANRFRPESLLVWETQASRLTATVAHLTAQTAQANAAAAFSGIQGQVALGELSLKQGMQAVEKRIKETQAELFESDLRVKQFEETMLPIAQKTRTLALAKAQLEHDILQRSAPLQLQQLEESIAGLREERAARKQQRLREQAGADLGALVYPQLLTLMGAVKRDPSVPAPAPDTLFPALAEGAGASVDDPAAQLAFSLLAKDALGVPAAGQVVADEELQ